MNVSKSPNGRPWALYSTYARMVACFLLLPLLVTGMVLRPEARLDFVATVLICMCCLYIDRDTVSRRARALPKGTPANDERDASS